MSTVGEGAFLGRTGMPAQRVERGRGGLWRSANGNVGTRGTDLTGGYSDGVGCRVWVRLAFSALGCRLYRWNLPARVGVFPLCAGGWSPPPLRPPPPSSRATSATGVAVGGHGRIASDARKAAAAAAVPPTRRDRGGRRGGVAG